MIASYVPNHERDIDFAKKKRVGNHEREHDVTIDGKYSSFVADVAELIVVRTREDLTIIATHELDLLVLRELLAVPWCRVFIFDFCGMWGWSPDSG